LNKNVFCTKKCISSDHVEERLNGSAAIAASRDLCGMLYNLHERLHFPLIWRASDSKVERFFSLLFSQTKTLNNTPHVCRCLPTWFPQMASISARRLAKELREIQAEGCPIGENFGVVSWPMVVYLCSLQAFLF